MISLGPDTVGPGVGEAAAGDRRPIAGRDGADWSA